MPAAVNPLKLVRVKCIAQLSLKIESIAMEDAASADAASDPPGAAGAEDTPRAAKRRRRRRHSETAPAEAAAAAAPAPSAAEVAAAVARAAPAAEAAAVAPALRAPSTPSVILMDTAAARVPTTPAEDTWVDPEVPVPAAAAAAATAAASAPSAACAAAAAVAPGAPAGEAAAASAASAAGIIYTPPAMAPGAPATPLAAAAAVAPAAEAAAAQHRPVAASPGPAAEDLDLGAQVGCGLSRGWKVPGDVLARVRSAVEYDDLDKKTKDMIYSAIRRGTENPECPPAVLARWAEDRASGTGRLQFMKEWVEDTSFAHVVVYERHGHRVESFDETEYQRVSRVELERRYEVDRFPNRSEWVDDVLRGARGRPMEHPDYPGSERHALHRVLKSVIDGSRNTSIVEQGLGLATSAAPVHARIAAAAAERLQEGSHGSRESIPQLHRFGGASNSKGGSPSKAKKAKAKAKAKAKPAMTEEEHAAMAALEVVKVNRKAAEGHIKVISGWKLRPQRAEARLKTANGSSKLTEAMIEDLQAEVQKCCEAEAVRVDCAGRGAEPPELAELKRNVETAAKAAEIRCKELGVP